MLPAQAVDTGAIALPARPTHSCSLYLPRPGTQRPLGDGDGGLWIWPGPQPPTGKGRPLVPSAHAGALATRKEEVRRQGLLPAPGCQDPQGAKIPRPQSPQGGASQDAPHPKALSCNPTSQMGTRRPREREGQSTHALLWRPPWALTLQLPLCPCQELQLELSWESARKRKRKLPSGQEGHWEWPQQAAYLARDLRLTLR